MRLTPLDDRVVIEPVEPESKTPGGIILPDQAKEKPKRGRVLAVGPGKFVPNHAGGFTRLPMTLSVGNLVCHGAYAGAEVTHPELGKLLVMAESEVMAVID